MAVVCKLALILFAILSIKRPCFTNASSICYTGEKENPLELKETFIYLSIWQIEQEIGLFVQNRYLISAHLKCLKDYNQNGAEKFLCNMCSKIYDESIDSESAGNVQQCYSNLNIKLEKRGLNVFHPNINGLPRLINFDYL